MNKSLDHNDEAKFLFQSVITACYIHIASVLYDLLGLPSINH